MIKMKKNKTILSLKEVRKRSKKFYFKLKEHVPLINPCSDVISGIVVKEFKPKLKKAGLVVVVVITAISMIRKRKKILCVAEL